MDAHRLKALIDIILADYKQFDIPMKFKSMLTALQEYANAPNPESAGKYRDQLAALKSALSQSRVHELQPLQRNILAKVGAIDFTGEGLIAQVETAHSKSTTPSDILLAVQDLAKRFEQFQKTIQGIVSHFEVLGIHARESAPDEQEISIILPDSLTRREILQVEKTLHKWGQAIGHIQELVLGRGTPVKLAAVDDGSIVVVIATVYSVAYATLKLVNMSLDTYEKVLAIRAKQRELRDMGVSKQTLESLAQDEATLAEKDVEKISEVVVSECGARELGGRSKSERVVQMRKTVQFVMRQIDQGVEIEILLPPPPASADAEDAATKGPSKDSVLREVKLASTSWRTLDREQSPVLQLPDPDLDSGVGGPARAVEPAQGDENVRPEAEVGAGSADGVTNPD